LECLRCRACGRRYPATPVHVCEFCFGPLEVDYRYDTLKTVVSRASIAAGPPSMWRYKDLLPVEGDVAVGHHVGFTPLIRAQNLADELGCREVWVKNDSVCHPSWSFKDRVVAVAVTKAKEFGYDTVACASTGNLANSVAAHAAEGRLKSYIFIPADLEQGKVLATPVYHPALGAVAGAPDAGNRRSPGDPEAARRAGGRLWADRHDDPERHGRARAGAAEHDREVAGDRQPGRRLLRIQGREGVGGLRRPHHRRGDRRGDAVAGADRGH